jgi:hypothetical protein
MIGIGGESKVMMVLNLGQGRSVTRTLIFGHWMAVLLNRQLGKEVSQGVGKASRSISPGRGHPHAAPTKHSVHNCCPEESASSSLSVT